MLGLLRQENKKIDWIDPMIKKEDAILGKYSKSVLDKESYY